MKMCFLKRQNRSAGSVAGNVTCFRFGMRFLKHHRGKCHSSHTKPLKRSVSKFKPRARNGSVTILKLDHVTGLLKNDHIVPATEIQIASVD